MKSKFNIGDTVITNDSSLSSRHRFGHKQIGTIIGVIHDAIHVKFKDSDTNWWFYINDVKLYIKLSSETDTLFRDILDG